MNDVLIIGSGPSALTLAVACGRQGLSVLCVALDPMQRWKQNFGSWTDEMVGSELETCIDKSWANPLVFTPHRTALHQNYSRIDTPKLQEHLLNTAQELGITLRAGRVLSVDHQPTHSTVTLSGGEALKARLIVDATGHTENFLKKSGGHASAWQVAYGQFLRVEGGHPWAADEMVLMDYRIPDRVRGHRDWNRSPTFLYVMPMSSDLVFVEETVLIHRPGISMQVLADRLAVRLADVGIRASSVESEEHCMIRMIGANPEIGQRTVGFGAAGGMIHPATGYSVTRVFREAPIMAGVLANHLDEGGSPARAAAAAWGALWPADRRRQWELYGFGADMLCQLDARQCQAFFNAFFAMQPKLWRGFHSATLPASGVAQAMSSLFFKSRASTKRMLLSAGASRKGIRLMRELMRA